MTKITIATNASRGPAVAALGDHLVVAALGQDGRTYVQQADPGWQWNAEWHEIPGASPGGAPAVAALDDHVVVVARGQDGRAYVQQADPGWQWNAQWHEIPGGFQIGSPPTVAALPLATGNHLVVVARSQNGHVYVQQADPGWQWNAEWNEIPGMTPSGPQIGDPPALAALGDHLVVAALGVDAHAYVQQADPGWQWNAQWHEIPGGGEVGSAPALAALPLATGNHLVAVALGQDGRAYVQQADPGWQWNAQWHEIPGGARP